MKSSKNIKGGIIASMIIALIMVLNPVQVSAQNSINSDDAILQTLSGYCAWNSAEFNGTIITDLLPISPRVKIYMVRDSLIQMSVRAPLIGEVLRADISTERLIIVNRMKKTYCDESTDNLLRIYPGAISDVQSLLLGRVIIFGVGELDLDNAQYVTVTGSDIEEGWTLTPPSGEGMIDLRYDYNIEPGGRTSQLNINVPSQKIHAELNYTYRNGERIDMMAAGITKQRIKAALDFSDVKWGGTPLSTIAPPANYKRVNVAEVLKF